MRCHVCGAPDPGSFCSYCRTEIVRPSVAMVGENGPETILCPSHAIVRRGLGSTDEDGVECW